MKILIKHGELHLLNRMRWINATDFIQVLVLKIDLNYKNNTVNAIGRFSDLMNLRIAGVQQHLKLGGLY